MFPTKKKKTDVENAADAKTPGDKKEDAKATPFNSSKLPMAGQAVAPLVNKKLALKKKFAGK